MKSKNFSTTTYGVIGTDGVKEFDGFGMLPGGVAMVETIRLKMFEVDGEGTTQNCDTFQEYMSSMKERGIDGDGNRISSIVGHSAEGSTYELGGKHYKVIVVIARKWMPSSMSLDF